MKKENIKSSAQIGRYSPLHVERVFFDGSDLGKNESKKTRGVHRKNAPLSERETKAKNGIIENKFKYYNPVDFWLDNKKRYKMQIIIVIYMDFMGDLLKDGFTTVLNHDRFQALNLYGFLRR